jgi:hypothetical protein
MRGVSKWASRVAPLLAVFVVFASVAAWAEEPSSPPTDPPEARIQPPGGVTAQARIQPPGGIEPPPPADGTPQARVSPPVGATSRVQPPVGGTARMNPPVGAPMTLSEMIRMWLQSRISSPNG